MASFEERRKEYFEDLKKYESYIVELYKDDKNKETVEILLFPKNEEELNLANCYIKFLVDATELKMNALAGNVENLDLNNSVLINFIVELFNFIYNDVSTEEIGKKIKLYTDDTKVVAEIVYQLSVFSIQEPEEFIEIVGNRCNVNLDDELELMRFGLILNQAIEKIKLYIDLDFTNDGKYDMEKQIDFCEKYHELCVKGIKQNSDSPKQKFKF